MNLRPAVQAFAMATAIAATGCARASSRELALVGFAATGEFAERTRTMELAPGVTATIVAPTQVDTRDRVDLILYALPNGNTTAQTMGRRIVPGLDWHFDIQHIAAQTRALRRMGMPQAIVIYLEADTRSWPAWRQRMGYEVANRRIVAMVDELRAAVGGTEVSKFSVTLTGHSGGGSFMFGFLEGQAAIPAWLDRIAFLDANYNFDGAAHGDKLAAWVRGDSRRTLVVMAYDDREIMLDGKKVVSDSGGTYRATERMMRYLRGPFSFASDTIGGFNRQRSEQIEVLVHPNPANRILHTEMIGEMNGYMHAMLVRRAEYSAQKAVLKPVRVYASYVEPE
jgi:hypothetical protein